MITPFRIEICGGMASGKTTFANLFCGTADLMLEDFTAVPFWHTFFRFPGSYNFETELSFLLQHYHQVKRCVVEGKNPGLLFCDFSFSLDRAYATVSLDRNKRQAFAAVLDEVLSEIGPPQLLVHLQCSAEAEMHRIQARRRSAEAPVTLQFLNSLDTAVDAEVDALGKSIAVLRFDSNTQDFASDVETKDYCRSSVLRAISELTTRSSCIGA